MTRTRIVFTTLAAALVLGSTAGGYWCTTLDDTSTISAVCVPEDTTDRDKAGNATTVALVTVDKPVEYREEEPGDGSGIQMSQVTVTEALKGTPPTTMVIGQSVTAPGARTAEHDPNYLPLQPGHHYVVGLTTTGEYRDGWVWFATAADTDPAAARSRWTDAVAHQNPPRPDHRCNDVYINGTPAPTTP